LDRLASFRLTPQDLSEVDDHTHGDWKKTDHDEPHDFLEPFHSASLMV
jgi:hypothetical protein